jgi:glycosyltransferase involved in cell wall biosynthesis
MPKVLHVSPSYPPAWHIGGPVESVYQFSRHVARAGAHVRVLTTDYDGHARPLSENARRRFESDERLEVRYCARLVGESVSSELLSCLARYVGWADVVHLHATFSFPTIPTLVAARVLNRPVVWTPHGALQRWRDSRRAAAKRAWERICRAVAPAKLVLHATSDEEAVESLERFGDATAVVIPNGVEAPARVERAAPNGRLRLGFIGRIEPIKGIENLLDACRLLSSRGSPAYSLTVAGFGHPAYEQSLHERVRASGLERDVEFVGEVRGDAKLAFFREADIVVVPSHTENFGLVVAEALAHGVPVVASRGTPWRRIEEKGCGLWVSNDPASLADAIQRLSRMPMAEMGERGRTWMREEFAWPECARKLLACYRALLGYRDIFNVEERALQ